MHSTIMDPTAGTCAGTIVELTDVLTMDIHIPTEDIQIPTEDIKIHILTASDNILVKFLVVAPVQARRPSKGRRISG